MLLHEVVAKRLKDAVTKIRLGNADPFEAFVSYDFLPEALVAGPLDTHLAQHKHLHLGVGGESICKDLCCLAYVGLDPVERQVAHVVEAVKLLYEKVQIFWVVYTTRAKVERVNLAVFHKYELNDFSLQVRQKETAQAQDIQAALLGKQS